MMVVALSDDVRARLDQHPDDRQIGLGGREVQGMSVVAEVANADVRAVLQQDADALEPISPAALCSAVCCSQVTPGASIRSGCASSRR